MLSRAKGATYTSVSRSGGVQNFYSWDRGRERTGTASVVKLVRWPSGSGTAEEYMAGTEPRGWEKLEYYAFIGRGSCGFES